MLRKRLVTAHGASARERRYERAQNVEIPTARPEELAPTEALARPVGSEGG
jgi:hypothetical protein